MGRDETKEGRPSSDPHPHSHQRTSRHMSRRPRVEARDTVRRDSEEQARMGRQMR